MSCPSCVTRSSLTTSSKGSRPADLNRDGIVTVSELYEYVEQQVTRKSRAVGVNPLSVMKPSSRAFSRS